MKFLGSIHPYQGNAVFPPLVVVGLEQGPLGKTDLLARPGPPKLALCLDVVATGPIVAPLLLQEVQLQGKLHITHMTVAIKKILWQ